MLRTSKASKFTGHRTHGYQFCLTEHVVQPIVGTLSFALSVKYTVKVIPDLIRGSVALRLTSSGCLVCCRWLGGL